MVSFTLKSNPPGPRFFAAFASARYKVADSWKHGLLRKSLLRCETSYSQRCSVLHVRGLSFDMLNSLHGPPKNKLQWKLIGNSHHCGSHICTPNVSKHCTVISVRCGKHF